jgi:ADP-L-glycero-D-manno-heptose 6-epimerase
MRVLLTGATGFIGSNIALALEEQGHEVIGTGSLHEQGLPEFKGIMHYMGVLGIDFESFGKIDALVHQGAISDTRVYDRQEMTRANVETSKALFEYAVAHGCKHIAYASSTAVYGTAEPPYTEETPVSPITPYGESKAQLDEYAMQFAKDHPDIPVIGLRYCNVYGPRENHKGTTSTMIYQFAHQMQAGNPKLFAPGEQKRDYIYVKDVVEANLKALTATESGIYNCGSGIATSFNDLVLILNSVLGLSRTPEYIDNPYGGAYQAYTLCDITRLKEKLGFTPGWSIEKGIKDYYQSGFLLK